jgi:hypothetical protein
VDRTVRYTLPDGMRITSQVTSKTTFDLHKGSRGRKVGPYDVNTTTALMEVIAITMAEKATDDAEKECGLES